MFYDRWVLVWFDFVILSFGWFFFSAILAQLYVMGVMMI